eukprot:753501-Hanusia_phi.AAC.4
MVRTESCASPTPSLSSPLLLLPPPPPPPGSSSTTRSPLAGNLQHGTGSTTGCPPCPLRRRSPPRPPHRELVYAVSACLPSEDRARCCSQRGQRRRLRKMTRARYSTDTPSSIPDPTPTSSSSTLRMFTRVAGAGASTATGCGRSVGCERRRGAAMSCC